MAERLTDVRNISPFLQIIKNFLLGRKHTPATSTLRYTAVVSARTQPPPVLPEGDAHKASANHYCLRDGRREVEPPTVLATNSSRKQIAAGKKITPTLKRVTPGKYWQWD